MKIQKGLFEELGRLTETQGNQDKGKQKRMVSHLSFFLFSPSTARGRAVNIVSREFFARRPHRDPRTVAKIALSRGFVKPINSRRRDK